MTEQPLAGLRVLELAGIGPPVHLGMMLADLGAEVVRVIRRGEQPPADTHLSRSRQHVQLDLKTAYGRDELLRRLAGTDVLVEGFRPGVMERLGLGPDSAHAVNPSLVYVRITGWGQTGPRSRQAGHDLNYVGLTGVLHAIGRKRERPPPPLNILGDFGGGSMLAMVGTLAALWRRERSGPGSVVDAAIVDGVSLMAQLQWQFLAAGTWVDEREANRLDGGAPYYDVYACAGDGLVAVAALEDKFWKRLLATLEIDEDRWADRSDPICWSDVRTVLADRFRTRTRDEWSRIFADVDACVTPVLSFGEAAHDEHLMARHTLRRGPAGVEASPAPRFVRSTTSNKSQS